MRRADGLEIYISQGAKPGFGGQLMAKKVTPELARIRGIPAGIDLRSPSRHPDILGADDLVGRGHDAATVQRVWRLLEMAEYKRRQAPPGIRISRRGFGRDWRYPITSGYKFPV